jgi:phthalate 4,5-cis-dihydrodiol dehydrogenase
LRLGVAGLGRAFVLMAPGLVQHPGIYLVAAADPRREARQRFVVDFGGSAYESVEQLCEDPEVEAIYVASPHQFHADHVIIAARNGKHVLVEKPMALRLEDCDRMIDAAMRAGVQMVIGHSHSFDLPIQRTSELIAGKKYGALCMITAVNFTDFLYRPRRPEELRSETGGGVLFNQAPHHVDVARLLAASRVASVRAIAGSWDPKRPAEGAYSCLLNFESGAFASLTYSGYAHFDSDEFMDWIAESGAPRNPDGYGAARTLIRNARSATGELALKDARNYGGEVRISAERDPARLHQHFGLLIASCENADLRPMPGAIAIYADQHRSFEPLPPPAIPRAEVIDEFYAAVVEGHSPRHDGAWGRATMEACFAIARSAREQREVYLI